jgi:beta-galactosidase
MKNTLFIFLIGLLLSGCSGSVKLRNEISLNGTWEIARTDSMSVIPDVYPAKIQVPGLVDMSDPTIDIQDTLYENSVYWYRRTFKIDDLNRDVIRLKINKAKYHTRVFVNGKPAGENIYCFTPSVFDIKPFLNDDEENELVIAVGCKNDLPDTVTNGWDFEKIRYIPGIYDNVRLIVADYPYIENVQVAPDIENDKLHVVTEIITGDSRSSKLAYSVRESVSKRIVASGSAKPGGKQAVSPVKVDFIVAMENYRLWSPEDPFLYDLEVSTKGDNKTTRFGMRSFAASRDSGVFVLNGKPYFMRGTNVCIYRFFEDPARKGLPWDSEWVTKLHGRFKEMYWNSIRYCIGFPPEKWYEIADSLGFLIQDEFPLWTGGQGGFKRLLGGINAKQLSSEYLEWMRERWNHPCAVVWDAQNESVNDTTAKAINIVRKFDLSDRPWDNGWAAPASEADAIESHPYLFSRYQHQKPSRVGYLKELLSETRIPGNDPNSHSPLPDGKRYENPIILNEYGWIWLNRDGSTTTLTDNVYKNVFPGVNTPEKRLEVYAKNLGILTEYWRSGRNAAAVMHFCGLGYSRPGKPRGQTSDHFTDLINLTYEPNFYKYVKQAFSPVGVMIEFWESSMRRGQQDTIPLHIINDTYERVSDTIKLSIRYGNEIISEIAVPYSLIGLQKRIIRVPVSFPGEPGDYTFEAQINFNGTPAKSIREFKIF